jgi:hypothetical protein
MVEFHKLENTVHLPRFTLVPGCYALNLSYRREITYRISGVIMSSGHSIQCWFYEKEDQQIGGQIKHMCEKYEIWDILAAPAVPHGSALATS